MQNQSHRQQHVPTEDTSRPSLPPPSLPISSRPEDTFRRQSLPPPPPPTLEPHSTQHGLSPYLSVSTHEAEQDRQRRQLPGLSELLSPASRVETTSPGRYASTSHLLSQAAPPATQLQRPTMATAPAEALMPSATFPSRPQLAAASHPYHPSHHPTHFTMQAPSSARNLSQYPPPAQGQQMPSTTDTRTAMIPYPALSSEALSSERRRDSARPALTFTAGTADCVGQRQIAGKGFCYVYKDGNTCPTVIDGELVNPLWGTTKAGKARKRLAQACL